MPKPKSRFKQLILMSKLQLNHIGLLPLKMSLTGPPANLNGNPALSKRSLSLLTSGVKQPLKAGQSLKLAMVLQMTAAFFWLILRAKLSKGCI